MKKNQFVALTCDDTIVILGWGKREIMCLSIRRLSPLTRMTPALTVGNGQ